MIVKQFEYVEAIAHRVDGAKDFHCNVFTKSVYANEETLAILLFINISK